MKRLKAKIHQQELKISAKKALVTQQYQQLKTAAQDKITSPGVLLSAFSLGFMIASQYLAKAKSAQKQTETAESSHLPYLIKDFLTVRNYLLVFFPQR
jgi:hypothetical protein